MVILLCGSPEVRLYQALQQQGAEHEDDVAANDARTEDPVWHRCTVLEHTADQEEQDQEAKQHKER